MSDSRVASKLLQIEKKVAKQLGVDQKIVRLVITETFKEIGWIIVFKQSPIMIRGFMKIVTIARGAKSARKIIKKFSELETRDK